MVYKSIVKRACGILAGAVVFHSKGHEFEYSYYQFSFNRIKMENESNLYHLKDVIQISK